MKTWKWLFLLSAIVTVPLVLLLRKASTGSNDARYDINDYITDEGL